jgi:hypothetical protein
VARKLETELAQPIIDGEPFSEAASARHSFVRVAGLSAAGIVLLSIGAWIGYRLQQRHAHAVVRTGPPVYSQPSSLGRDVSLSQAVREFNAQAKADLIGVTQPELTENEVIASIRAWKWLRREHPISDAEFTRFQAMADLKMLPKGARLSFCSGWTGKEQDLEVWWIDISLPTGPKSGYTYRIRDQRLRALPAGTLERRHVRGPFGLW